MRWISSMRSDDSLVDTDLRPFLPNWKKNLFECQLLERNRKNEPPCSNEVTKRHFWPTKLFGGHSMLIVARLMYEWQKAAKWIGVWYQSSDINYIYLFKYIWREIKAPVCWVFVVTRVTVLATITFIFLCGYHSPVFSSLVRTVCLHVCCCST